MEESKESKKVTKIIENTSSNGARTILNTWGAQEEAKRAQESQLSDMMFSHVLIDMFPSEAWFPHIYSRGPQQENQNQEPNGDIPLAG